MYYDYGAAYGTAYTQPTYAYSADPSAYYTSAQPTYTYGQQHTYATPTATAAPAPTVQTGPEVIAPNQYYTAPTQQSYYAATPTTYPQYAVQQPYTYPYAPTQYQQVPQTYYGYPQQPQQQYQAPAAPVSPQVPSAYPSPYPSPRPQAPQQPAAPVQQPGVQNVPQNLKQGGKSMVTGQRRALIVGINYPNTRMPLSGCINDAQNMFRLLTQQYGFRPTDCLMFTDEQGPRSPNPPTRSNILAGIDRLVQGAQPGDCLVFSFAGHGSQTHDPTQREVDGLAETLVCSDYNMQTGENMITDDEIFQRLIKPLPAGCKLFAIFDCCHSGTALDLPYIYTGSGWMDDPGADFAMCDAILISGCQDEQTSADSKFDGASGGAMTKSFLVTLNQGQALSYSELLDGMTRWLSRMGFSQKPNLTSMQQFDIREPFSMNTIFNNTNDHVGQPPGPRQRKFRPSHFVRRKKFFCC
uniref:Peptidase C14 caspase domain-containing protein n=1 Tax=Chromera velia CCMP2878 TaxID=1169474 RepID=A0A0G4HYZ6_9ALVE|mmetsp:Transcript_39194/g.77101  ORF Transcript_39194/g.77101 Transcript_39194/m.77101 type:complete len:467 (-) Transcript_39194:704-2104(-)|eukprot:Cvel_9614.t1-p1 / transcript=Cvel_9614.t1 / gene=Cvel_9614 / organism=Chromera_velia_CCMP2878 / gene_product=Metacaspase-1, putative / transcript_product=Metacaspase-1, putative / location=Cvel_scaffold558:71592-75048(+) / protein_length=466 / sequence_SO=supercontig / SO=protein_coding / is_pseudo=false